MSRFITDQKGKGKIHALVGELDWRMVGRSKCEMIFPVEKFSDGSDDSVTCQSCKE